LPDPDALAAGWNDGIGRRRPRRHDLGLGVDHPPPRDSPEPRSCHRPVLRFLVYLLDDFAEEWLYRHAVGTRWLFDENARSAAGTSRASLEVPGDIGQCGAS
jgi:hypothetical protein